MATLCIFRCTSLHFSLAKYKGRNLAQTTDRSNNHYSKLEWYTQEYILKYGTRIQRISKPVIAYNNNETLFFNSMTEATFGGFTLSAVSGDICGNN